VRDGEELLSVSEQSGENHHPLLMIGGDVSFVCINISITISSCGAVPDCENTLLCGAHVFVLMMICRFRAGSAVVQARSRSEPLLTGEDFETDDRTCVSCRWFGTLVPFKTGQIQQ
jgi:hypothetical protein